MIGTGLIIMTIEIVHITAMMTGNQTAVTDSAILVVIPTTGEAHLETSV